MVNHNDRCVRCQPDLTPVVGVRQGSRESQEVDWVETRLGRPFRVCPEGTGNIPIDERRPHGKDDCLF